jgi:nucleoside 2-deoxyribosyltransferase
MKSVYLAGPITGHNFKGCTDWRAYAAASLADVGIKGVSPMRGKDYLASLPVISGHGQEYAHMGVLSTSRAVMTRDRFDCTRCDAVLVNLLGAERVSIGTMIELGWADGVRRPIICAIEQSGNVHEHMMVSEAIGFRVPTLEEALHVCKVLFA